MKNLLLAACIIVLLSSCKKDDPPVISGNSTPPPAASKYGGEYFGIFYEHVAGVDSTGVFKHDTTYAYTVTIEDVGANQINIHGQTDINAIDVDSTGHFEFNDYNRNIEGNFIDDSLYIYSDAISGSYDPPQWYLNTQLSFKGEKQ